NVLTDAYGGDVACRTRIVAELVAGIRAACGSGFIIGLKLPGDDGVPGGVDRALAARIAVALTAPRNVDFVCFAQGSHARSLERHVPDGDGARVPSLELIRELRKAIPGVPLAALGRITDPAEADAIVEQGDAELVALGRALVADPAWPRKAATGRTHDIRYCVSCNSCWERITALRLPLGCDNNPRVAAADEVDYWPAPAPAAARKRIVVVGAGVAGLEAAWVAAARGHAVTLFGGSAQPGGKARLRAQLPGGEALSSVYDYQSVAAERAGVKLELGRAAEASDVLALAPHAVVLASGARMLPPPWLPADALAAGLVPDLRTAMAQALRYRQRQRGTAVIFDMDHGEATYGAAEMLHALFDRVVVVTPRESVAQETPLVVRQGILRRLARKRIDLRVLCEPRWSDAVENGALELVDVYTGELAVIPDVAFFAFSTPRASDDALAQPLRAAGVPVRAVGDAFSARNLMAATAEGHAAGLAV
ncbi:MAG: NAD(P)-binding protein, partial [Variibacter sp.]|nr:NAD(P)-binding protein [Variibacter sp.]